MRRPLQETAFAPNKRGLGYGDALPSDVEVSYHGPTTALRISIDWEDHECNGSNHLIYGNGNEM
jgi:hypothetical protein